MNGLQVPQEEKKLTLSPFPELFPEKEKKEEGLALSPFPDLFAKEEPLIPGIIEPEKETIPQRRLLPLGSKLTGLQEIIEKLSPQKPLETTPMGGGLLREVAPPDVQERMAEATREPQKLDLGQALQSLDKAGGDVLGGVTESATGLITGIPTFLAGATAQGVETLYSALKDAYNSWKIGFKNIETFEATEAGKYLLKTVGESTSTRDWLRKLAEPWQPKTKTGTYITEVALAPVTGYMEGVRMVAELTSDNPAVQEGIVWLGDILLIFGAGSAKSYIKNQIKAKAPIVVSKLKGMLIESDKVPREIKQKIVEIPDVLPKEAKALSVERPVELPIETPVAPVEPFVTPEAPIAPVTPKLPVSVEPPIAPEVPILKSTRTIEVPVKDIKLSKDVPNFKAGANVTTGIVPGKQLTGEFKRMAIEPIVIWRRKNGDLEVITGRHKLDLAKRKREKTIPAQIVDESEMYDKKWAMTIDAESNIRNEQGEVSDYAHYFKNTDDTAAQAEKRSLLSRVKQKDGWRLGKDLVNDVYNAYIGNQISENKALAIARGAPGNETAQGAALSKAKKYSPEELESFATLLANTERSTMTPESQGGLFGFDDSAIRETEAVAKEVGKEIRATKDRILSVQGALKRPALARTMGLEFTDEPSLRKEVSNLESRIENLKRVHTSPELYDEMRRRAGLLEFEPEIKTPPTETPIKPEIPEPKITPEPKPMEINPPPKILKLEETKKPLEKPKAKAAPTKPLAKPLIPGELALELKKKLGKEELEPKPLLEKTEEIVDAVQKNPGTKELTKLKEVKTELQKTDAGKVEWNFIEQETELKELKRPTYRKAIAALERTVVDTSGNIKKKLVNELGWRGKAAVEDKNLTAGASSWATHLIEEAQKKIYGEGKSALSKKEEIILNRYLQSARTTAIHEYKPEVKRPGGLYDEHFEWQKGVPPKIKEAANKYNKVMFEQLDNLHKEGLITADEVKRLKSVGMYEKSKFIQHLDPMRSGFSPGGTKINVPDSGIKALKEGSERALELDSRLLLREVVTRTQGRIFNNRANKSLYDLAKEVPDNGIVRPTKVIGKTKKGTLKYETVPAGHTPITAMIEGKPKMMFMRDEFAAEWIKRDPLISQGLAQAAQWLSGNKILKAMATGINPGFAVTNLPRDIAHVFLTTEAYSSHVPVFAGQMLRDLMKVKHDAFSGKGEWINYLKEGGGMNWLTFQGKAISGRTGTKLANLQELLGKAGEVSERWTRLALRERGIKTGMTPKEATAYARDYLDFNQGGSVIKALDQGIPYLNAGIQGTRGITRAAGRAPGKTAYKIAQIMGIASGLYIANNKINKECYDSITPRDKQGNWIITTPFHWTDKKGNERYLFMKIAKDQGQRIFCSIAENLIKKITGQPVDVEEITGAAQDAIQILPITQLPPTISAILGYTANKDWWLNEDIWRGPKVKPGEEKTVYTHPALEKAGKLGLSPSRLDYALKQVFTRGNVYTSMVSGGVGFLLSGLPEKDKGKILPEIITQLPIIKRVFELTPPYSPKELKEQEEAKVRENTRKQKQKLELNKMANTYYRKLFDEDVDDKSLHKDIDNFIKKQPDYDHSRLTSWVNDYGKVYNIPEKSWWLQLMNQSPEVRALLFFNKYTEANEKKKKEMVELLNKLPSLKSPRADEVFGALMKAYKEAIK